MADGDIQQKQKTLRPRQLAFVAAYLRCWNASQAYRESGGKGKNANVHGARMMANDSIRAEIDRVLDERAMSAREVIDRLSEHGRGAWGEYINSDGSVDIARLKADGKAYLIRETEITRHTYKDGSVEVTGKVKFPDSQAAIIQVGRHHKLFTDKLETSADEKEVNAAIERELAKLGLGKQADAIASAASDK